MPALMKATPSASHFRGRMSGRCCARSGRSQCLARATFRSHSQSPEAIQPPLLPRAIQLSSRPIPRIPEPANSSERPCRQRRARVICHRGVFALLFDAGIDVGVSLVQHPAVKAVAFTGSASGGQALMRLAANRPDPIPCYAEMGSTNPLFILPQAMRERSAQLAKGVQTSFTMGSGQFCTKPGMVFVPQGESADFLQSLREGVGSLEQFGMLTHGIANKYNQAIQQRLRQRQAELIAGTSNVTNGPGAAAPAVVFGVSLSDFLDHPELGEEVFGPTTLLVHYRDESELEAVAKRLQGHLTATIHGTTEDLARAHGLIRVLETKVGRIVFNGFPTGVEVNHAMVHGGPFPATSDGRSTSVGSQAILRFVRPICYQDFPHTALPLELQPANPLGIMRLVNGTLTRS